jgi:tricorn protease
MVLLRKVLIVSIVCYAGLALAQQVSEGRLLRFPDINKDKIAFTYAGDIWIVSSLGGVAQRLTTHPGRELFPKFSPDGNWIAFTGEYDGTFNVYVMPANGGQPKQLTFYQGGPPLSDRMGINNEVLTWTADSKRILFLSCRDAPYDSTKRPFSVSIDGGLATPLPIPEGGLTSFSPDGNKIAYNRFFRNFRTWKRYTGGLAQSITIYDLKNNTVEGVPHTEWTDTFPMWHGNTIYFASDRGDEHRLNLYSYDLGSRQIEQLTHFTDFDVMWPSIGPDAIVFENAGYLYTFDLQSKQAKKQTISVTGERDASMKHWASVSKYITDFDISPEGNRATFSARGDVFTVPAKEGSIRNITHTPGIREQLVSWSPDGRSIAYISDRTGEDEIYIAPQDGIGKKEQITSGYSGFKSRPVWSPDSKKIAWADKNLQLWYIDLEEKKPNPIDRAKYGEITNYAWSPDSKWLAYDKAEESNYSTVYLWSLAEHRITPVTSSMTNSYSPVFDPDGKYLYFLSDRDFNEVLGNLDFEFVNPKTTRVYLIALQNDEPSPFKLQSDEAGVKRDEPAPTAERAELDKTENKMDSSKQQRKEKQKPKELRIDLEGIQGRVVALPTDPAVINTLSAAKGFVYYSTKPVSGLSGPIPGESSAIHVYDLKERKEKVLIEHVESFILSFDGSKLLYETDSSTAKVYGIIDSKAGDQPKKPGDGMLNLDAMKAEIDPPQEWKQMFNEAWRQERDYFFEAAMNGVDWQKVKDKYAQLLPFVADRYSLTYILGEMVGELSNSHTYVGGGDYPDLHPVNVGLLGADFELDQASGMYRIKKIFPGENWDDRLRSPLMELGADVQEGDYLVAVDGRSLRAPQDPYELFINTANETITLTVNSKPSEDGARQLQVKPISDEGPLRQLDMVETNRKKIDAASHGRVGYIYLPDLGGEGLNAFVKQFFPQIRKEGLIIDVRYNGGGFVDPLIFERLRRVLAGMFSRRNRTGVTVPMDVFHGSMVCISNQWTGSDGDIFSYLFKYYNLGLLVGERTWGGVRGVYHRPRLRLIDGGYVSRPEFAMYDLNSKWIIENKGVQPDIVVENRPDLVVKGQDPQLEKALELVMKAIQENPKKLPARPPDMPAYPDGPGM